MQQYEGIYLLQNYSTCMFRVSVARVHDMTCTRSCSHSFMNSRWRVRWTPETCRVIYPSSGVHKNVTAASGTGHITYPCDGHPKHVE